MPRLVIRVNGRRHVVKASPDTPLLYVLRNELHLQRAALRLRARAVRGVHRAGRRQGDPLVRDACRRRVAHKPVTTLEGLGTAEKPHPLQKAFIDHQAAQCGYCTNGMIMAADRVPEEEPASRREDEIKRAMTRGSAAAAPTSGSSRPSRPRRRRWREEAKTMTNTISPPRRFSRRRSSPAPARWSSRSACRGCSNPKAAFARAGATPDRPGARRPDADRLVARDPRRRHGHGLHRQGRARHRRR